MTSKFSLLVILLLPAAFAQAPLRSGTISCALSVPVIPALSPSSSSALVGDLFADCTDSVPAPSIGSLLPQTGLAVTFNLSVVDTTQPLWAFDAPGTPSNPNSLLCATPSTGCTGIVSNTPYDGSAGRPNLFEAVTSGFLIDDVMVFYGVPIQSPGLTGHLSFEFKDISVSPLGQALGTKVYARFPDATDMLNFTNPLQVVAVVAAPEPASLSLCALALGLAVLRRCAARS